MPDKIPLSSLYEAIEDAGGDVYEGVYRGRGGLHGYGGVFASDDRLIVLGGFFQKDERLNPLLGKDPHIDSLGRYFIVAWDTLFFDPEA
jgi:hypothetical protein